MAEPEKANALEQVSKAEEAAKRGDGSRMLSALQSAGRMARDLAVGVGSGLLVEVIKKANGGAVLGDEAGLGSRAERRNQIAGRCVGWR